MIEYGGHWLKLNKIQTIFICVLSNWRAKVREVLDGQSWRGRAKGSELLILNKIE